MASPRQPTSLAQPAAPQPAANLRRLDGRSAVPMPTAIARPKRSSLPPPYTIVPYNALDIGCRLGAGSFAKVYKAEYEQELKGDYEIVAVAVKFYPEKYHADFQRELAVLTRISKDGFKQHPNLVGFYGAGYDLKYKCHHLVLEYMRKKSLEEYLKNMQEGLGWSTILKAAIGIAAGLVDLHAMGFINRDVKPANVLIGDDEFEQVKLSDFGITIKATDSKREVQGSPYYLAPEVMTDKATQASDVYSFGVVLLQMLSPAMFLAHVTKMGDKLWMKNIPENISGLAQIIFGSLKCPPARQAEQKDFIDNVVRKCLEIDPAKRPTMQAVLDKLKHLQQAYLQRVSAPKVTFAVTSALVMYSQFKPPAELPPAVEEPIKPYIKLEPVSLSFGIPRLGCL